MKPAETDIDLDDDTATAALALDGLTVTQGDFFSVSADAVRGEKWIWDYTQCAEFGLDGLKAFWGLTRVPSESDPETFERQQTIKFKAVAPGSCTLSLFATDKRPMAINFDDLASENILKTVTFDLTVEAAPEE